MNIIKIIYNFLNREPFEVEFAKAVAQAKYEIYKNRQDILYPAMQLATCARKHGLDRVVVKPWVLDKIRAALFPNVYVDKKLTEEGIEHFLVKGIPFVYGWDNERTDQTIIRQN